MKAGRYKLAISETTFFELDRAPKKVQLLQRDIPEECIYTITLTDEITELRDAYVRAGVVGASNILDDEHIACASVGGVDVIVSWNFKHIVHFDKIRGYHAVNLRMGYGQIPIHSPREAIENYEE